MSYEYNPANLGNPLYRQASQAEQCPGVIQKPPGSQQQLLLTPPSSTRPQPQIQLPTSTSDGGSLPQSRNRGEDFEYGGVLPPISSVCVLPSNSTGSATPNIEYGGVLQSSATQNVASKFEYAGGLPSGSRTSSGTPNVASANLLQQLVLDRPKLPLSRLMQVSSFTKGCKTQCISLPRRSRPTL